MEVLTNMAFECKWTIAMFVPTLPKLHYITRKVSLHKNVLTWDCLTTQELGNETAFQSEMADSIASIATVSKQ